MWTDIFTRVKAPNLDSLQMLCLKMSNSYKGKLHSLLRIKFSFLQQDIGCVI